MEIRITGNKFMLAVSVAACCYIWGAYRKHKKHIKQCEHKTEEVTGKVIARTKESHVVSSVSTDISNLSFSSKDKVVHDYFVQVRFEDGSVKAYKSEDVYNTTYLNEIVVVDKTSRIFNGKVESITYSNPRFKAINPYTEVVNNGEQAEA